MPVLLSSLSFLVSLSIPSFFPFYYFLTLFILSSLLFFLSSFLSTYPVLASLLMTRGYQLTHESSYTYPDGQTSLVK